MELPKVPVKILENGIWRERIWDLNETDPPPESEVVRILKKRQEEGSRKDGK